MKKIFLGLAMGVMLALLACNSAPDTATFSQLSKDENGKLYYGSSLYTGTATSEDGTFLMMEIKDGSIVSIEAHHNNGAVALTNNIKDGAFALFNQFGEQIDEHEFQINYMSIQNHIDEELSKLQRK